MPQVGRVAKRFLPEGQRRQLVLPVLLTPVTHPCIVRRYKVLRSATNHAWGPFHVVKAPHCRQLLSPCASSSCAFLENSIRRHAVNYHRVFLLLVLLLGVALLQRTRAVCAGDEW